jgi:methionine synthase II (cobalamin-independent)
LLTFKVGPLNGRKARESGRCKNPKFSAERLYPCTNCGMAPMAAGIAYAKLSALAAGAELARKEMR